LNKFHAGSELFSSRECLEVAQIPNFLGNTEKNASGMPIATVFYIFPTEEKR
jgi:hypothetical protein